MDRGRRLPPRKIAVIITLQREGYNPTEIARRVNSSRGAVRNALVKRHNRKNAIMGGRPSNISSRTARIIARAATNNLSTARQLRNRFVPDVSVRTVQLVLQNAAQ